MKPPRSFSPEDQALYRAIDEVLHYIWDPIGISGTPSARDEYTSYLPPVFAMLHRGASKIELSTHLQRLSEEHMGVGRLPERGDAAALALAGWCDHLSGKVT
ncbi:hypothetical protein [Marilutibacter chinensis]|uniref:Uncharacterized protein n=1 Tax=Marilutibacter chinensis TaxID=2912247 RepID=A0ABS9HW66_9GAMM|nr:hypothetical protein [Lysobacter chinensis]MCF7222585.1 hypothetical protein [Lysobacter chinensis]